MENTVRGLDNSNFTIWEAFQLNESYHHIWIGSSRKTLIVRFTNVEAVIEYFLDTMPTESIHAYINDTFHTTMLSQVSVKQKMDVLKEMLHLDEVATDGTL